ncbi:MAG TPA: hypothetical protein VMD75_00605 [Candidatus Binataceae bacterium]|nr:hypothetical protein [Candidatus Binataceae bacterium]
MNGEKRPRVGRKAVRIDLTELEKLSSLQCTDEEIAHFFDVSVRTIERRKKKPAFASAIERGRAKGRLSVRRTLFNQANNGNIAAAIFLAKNVLGYRDVLSNEHSTPDGATPPIQLMVVQAGQSVDAVSPSQLSDIKALIRE